MPGGFGYKKALELAASWGPLIYDAGKNLLIKTVPKMMKNLMKSPTLKTKVAAIVSSGGVAGKRLASLLLTPKGLLVVGVAGASYHFVAKADDDALKELGGVITSGLPKNDAARWWQIVNDEIRAFWSIFSDAEEREYIELTTLGLLNAVKREMIELDVADPQLTDAWQLILRISGSLPDKVKESLKDFKAEDVLGPLASYANAASPTDAIAMAGKQSGPSEEDRVVGELAAKAGYGFSISVGQPVTPYQAKQISASLSDPSSAVMTPDKAIAASVPDGASPTAAETNQEEDPQASPAWPYALAAGGSVAGAITLLYAARKRGKKDEELVEMYAPDIVLPSSTRNGKAMTVDNSLILLDDHPFELLRRSL